MKGESQLLTLVIPGFAITAGFSQLTFTADAAGKLPAGVYGLQGSEFVRSTGSASTGLQWRLEALTVHGLSLSGVGSFTVEGWGNGRLGRLYTPAGQVLVVPPAASCRMYFQGTGGSGDTGDGRIELVRLADYSASAWIPGRRYGKVTL